MKFWKKCPFFLMLLVSGCLFAAAGYAGTDSIYRDYRTDSDLSVNLSAVFRGWKDGVYPWMVFSSLPESEVIPEQEAVIEIETETEDFEKAETESEPAAEIETGELIVPAESHGPQYDKFGVLISDEVVSLEDMSAEETADDETADELSKGEVPEEEVPQEKLPAEEQIAVEVIPEEPENEVQQSQSVSENTVEEFPSVDVMLEENRTYDFTAVDESYFKDALFIGDSRTVGLDLYAKFPEETDFIAANSTSIYQIFEKPKKIAVLSDGSKATVEEALKEKQYGKIYIMLGINEIGGGTTAGFFTSYAEAVNKIRLLQPNAVIFVQAIMRVTAEKSADATSFKNERINERNQALALMANQKDIFYLEINDALCDETGALIADYTYDQVHLKAKYYLLWKDYLLAHGIVKE